MDHEEYTKPSKAEVAIRRVGKFVRQKWEEHDKPGVFELHFYYLPVAAVMLAAGVQVADQEFDTHIADRMVSVHTVNGDNGLERGVKHTLHEIGAMAGGHDVAAKHD